MFEHSQLLESVFGLWPSFHDAEVHHVVFDRNGSDGPSIEMRIHVFLMTPELDDRGFLITKHHTMATLRFSGVHCVEVQGFNGQNVINDLEVERVDAAGHEGCSFSVKLPALHGLSASFRCVRCIVVDAQPFPAPI